MINNITITSRRDIDLSYIGGIICRTPKTVYVSQVDSDGNITEVNHKCELISSTEELLEYYGNPFIDPTAYTDLVIAYDIVRRGFPLYISSVYDMEDNNDGFEIRYNGYTEFTFIDTDDSEIVGYRLKSNIKFCQPIIRTVYNGVNKLYLYVDLYLLDMNTIQDSSTLKTFNPSQFYKTINFIFDTSDKNVDDNYIVSSLWANGLELKIVNADLSHNRSLLNAFISYPALNIYFKSYYPSKENANVFNEETGENEIKSIYNDSRVERFSKDGRYWYDLHSSDYKYNFSNEETVVKSYVDAIDLMAEKGPAPHLLSLGNIQVIKTVKNSKDLIIRSYAVEAEYSTYIAIQTYLLSVFNEDCDTYLFISTPDVSLSKVTGVLSLEDSNIAELPYNYNCDLYFGYATDYINRAMQYSGPAKVFYPASLLSFYNMLINKSIYESNDVVNLNISNKSVKSIISEDFAKRLVSLRCNSIVLFDVGSPSIYGCRSLSLSPNLRYSYISRNLVRLRRLIKEYLETKKFTLKTLFTIDSYINYIKTDILESFRVSGVIRSYLVNYSFNQKTVYINISLNFEAFAETLNLSFII